MSTRVDRWLIILFFMLGAFLGLNLISVSGSVFFYQANTPEALMWACGRGFQHPQALSPEMVDFLRHRVVEKFDCAAIPPHQSVGPPGHFANMQLYLTWAVASLWRLLGTTQMALAPLVAALAATYAAGAYFLARLFLPTSLAAVAAGFLTLSPYATNVIFLLRDFSKGPFFLWSIALLIVASRSGAVRSAMLIAAAAGIVAGIGYGFRSDLMILLPVGLLFLCIAPNSSPGRRIGLLAAFGGAFLVLASPLLSLDRAGGLSGVFVMQGATEPFREFLRLDPAPYALGHAYSDELTLSGIAAAEIPRRPEWDEREGARVYGVSQAMSLSTGYLMQWAPRFSADFFAQGLKAAGWILGYPALVTSSQAQLGPGTPPLREDLATTRFLVPIYSTIGKSSLVAIGFVGLFAWLLMIAADRPRETIGLALVLLIFLMSTGIQFSVRHIFHLEFVWVISLLSIPMVALKWRFVSPFLPSFAGWAIAVLLLPIVIYWGLAALQQRLLTTALSDLLSLPREITALTREFEPNGSLLWRVPIPAGGLAIMGRSPDAMIDPDTAVVARVGPPHEVRAFGTRMLMELDGSDCPQRPAQLQLVYKAYPGQWQRFDSILEAVPRATVVFTAFYRATQSFEGVRVPPSHVNCELTTWSVPLTRDLPLVFTAVLQDDWAKSPLRKAFGDF